MPSELPIPTPNGFDTVIAQRNPAWADFLPEGVEARLFGRGAVVIEGWPTERAEDLVKVAIVLNHVVRQAIQLGGLPDHVAEAWFTVTANPKVVKRYGEAHDCPTCRAGTDQALARLRNHPEEPLLVGILAF